MSIAALDQPVSLSNWTRWSDRRASTAVRVERRLQSISPLVIDDGCDVRPCRARYGDVVRVSLLEWLPLTRSDLLAYESGLLPETAAPVLAALVRPPTIWSAGEALLAARIVGGEKGPGERRRAALLEHAFTRLGSLQLARLREVAERFARQLPVDGLPQASATVAHACAVVVHDDETCAAIAATVLVRYAESSFVARRRSEAVPTMI